MSIERPTLPCCTCHDHDTCARRPNMERASRRFAGAWVTALYCAWLLHHHVDGASYLLNLSCYYHHTSCAIVPVVETVQTATPQTA